MEKKSQRKVLTLRLPKELWKFIRIQSFQKEVSANELIETILMKYKKKIEKDLTPNIDVIS